MFIAYIKLSIAAALPILAVAAVRLLERKTALIPKKNARKQIVCGILFGLLAVVGTEWGIPINGAQVNCRDAAVVVAGLLFGGPAGVLAGLIGGIERWFSVYWGVGAFTRVACTISTILAGFFAAALRKYLFDNKKPGWLIAFAVGTVIEVFHLTMVFVTNMATPAQAMAAVQACSLPMITANGLSVMLATVVDRLFDRHEGAEQAERPVTISQTIQKWLIAAVLLALLATFGFVYSLQNAIASAQEDQLLTLALNETEADIKDASNHNLLRLAKLVASEMQTFSLDWVAYKYGLAEINVVNRQGIIVDSTVPEFVGYDMAGGEQSAAFLCLLDGETEYTQDYGPISYDRSISRKYAGIRTDDGFIQVGYDADQFQKDIDSDLVGITKNRHVGQTGFILIIDEQYQIVSAPESMHMDSLRNDILNTKLPGVNITFRATLDGLPCSFQYRSAEGYHIVAAVPVAEVVQTRDVALYVNAYMQILVFAVLFSLIYLLIQKVVVSRMKEVNTSLSKITDGDLDEVVNVRSNEEFASLSDDINQTVGTLKRYIDEAAARIDKELELAKTIQTSSLPTVFPQRKEFDIFASMDPAKEVGGDFYDFYMTDSHTLNFLVADVSGKGIPAAMFMMRAKTELKSQTETKIPLGDAFTNSNQLLCEGNDAGMFVTVWQGQLDLRTGLVRFANAGHNPPLIKNGDGEFRFFKSKAGFILAGLDDMDYETQELQLAPGDMIFLYTDGVTEARNSSRELFGDDRLAQTLNSAHFETMQQLCTAVRSEVDAFAGDAPQFDDITMVALRYNGAPAIPVLHFDEAEISDMKTVKEFVGAELDKLHCDHKIRNSLFIALDEVFSNIVHYAYQDKRGPITLKFRVKEDPRRISIRIEDSGIPYNPLVREEPNVDEMALDDSIGGLGIFMVKQLMDAVKYKFDNDQNILTIEKFLE